jgi:Zn finger protein HypA/HybF involved in hydrogenase expression
LRFTLDDVPGNDLTLPADELQEPDTIEELADEFWYCFECDECWELEDNVWDNGRCPFCDSDRTDILTTEDYTLGKVH